MKTFHKFLMAAALVLAAWALPGAAAEPLKLPEGKVAIHYFRADGSYSGWGLHVWQSFQKIEEADDEPISFDGGRLQVDPVSRRFTLVVAVVDRDHAAGPNGAEPIRGRLTPGEAGLLIALARRPGTVLSRERLLDAVTRRPDDVYDRVVDVHVANLRRKLHDDPVVPWLIETIPQVGYRLVASRDPS